MSDRIPDPAGWNRIQQLEKDCYALESMRDAALAEVKRLRDIFVMAGDEQTDLAAEVIRCREQEQRIRDLADELEAEIDGRIYPGASQYRQGVQDAVDRFREGRHG